jgi:rRNA maturation protein Nop10
MTTYCKFKDKGTTDDGRYVVRCSVCGVELQTLYPANQVVAPCGVLTQPTENKGKPPNLIRRGWNYWSAKRKWKKAGKPVRSDEEVEFILETLCKPCNEYTEHDTCRLCGCPLNQDANALNNKIRMATESCPIGKWKSKHDG